MQASRSSCEDQKSYWRHLRKFIDIGLPIVGTIIIFSVVLFRQELRDMIFVVIGFLMIEVGAWKVAHKLLPNERKYHALRREGDQFLALIQQLNSAALLMKEDDTPANREAFERVQSEMQSAIDRMAVVAGKTDSELTDTADQAWKNDFFGVAP
jgi:hypothetical protein